jgi:hypothetical protein
MTGKGSGRPIGSVSFLPETASKERFEAKGLVSTSDAVSSTLILSRFVNGLQAKVAPVILDFGPAIGANVTFLGEQFGGCKLFVEDLLANIPIPSTMGDDDEPEVKTPRLSYANEVADGILCWDVLDYLSSKAGFALAKEVVRVLRPGGLVLLCHGTESLSVSGPTGYEIIDQNSLRYRFRNGATMRSRRVIQSGEVTRLFSSLTIVDSILLKSHMREVLLRKPSKLVAAS